MYMYYNYRACLNLLFFLLEMGKLLLDVISYLMALDSTSPLFFPTMYATCLIYINPTLWSTAVDIIIHQLCYYALPMAICECYMVLSLFLSHIHTFSLSLYFYCADIVIVF